MTETKTVSLWSVDEPKLLLFPPDKPRAELEKVPKVIPLLLSLLALAFFPNFFSTCPSDIIVVCFLLSLSCSLRVSQIFMKPDFALEDPATFNAVLPWSHFNSAGGKSSRDVSSSKLLQEKVKARLSLMFTFVFMWADNVPRMLTSSR